MLITLHDDQPHVVYDEFPHSLVVAVVHFKNWESPASRGLRIISKKQHSTGYRILASLHEPTIYTLHTNCRKGPSSWQVIYSLLLMQGEDDWCVEMGVQQGQRVTLNLPGFDPDPSVTA